jgi:hypothetical protein
MATDSRIECVTKSDGPGAHERIRFIGGKRDDGTPWKLSQEVAVLGMDEGRWLFYIMAGKDKARVVVATSQGHRYLKTTADGEQPESLLGLPECP